MNRNDVLGLIEAAVDSSKIEILEQIQNLTDAVQRLQTNQVEVFEPVTIQTGVGIGKTNLDLVKSLPQFGGDPKEYPAWREAAKFAMNYYLKGSETYYVAMGILRNKIISEANSTLSAFNTIFNFDAIISRLDQCYSDKRPLYLLENELSVLRQGKLSITEYYDQVNKQLTLIINKIIMTHSGKEEIIEALNDRARSNALRVFISGLRRPLCDICFSTNPPDLPTALATAQELEQNHERYKFANAFALSKNISQSNASNTMPRNAITHPGSSSLKQTAHYDNPVPMEVDKGTSYFRKPTTYRNVGGIERQKFNHDYSNQKTVVHENQPKRPYTSNNSGQSPVQKLQKINYVQNFQSNESIRESDDFSGVESENDVIDDLNFLV